MKQSDLDRKPRVTPFSNGTEAMCWEYNNCGSCKRNKKLPDSTCGLDIERANKGLQCRWEIHIGYGWLDGSVAQYAAEKIGWTEEKGWLGKCILWIDKDQKGPPRKPRPKPVAPNQGLLFTEFDNLLNKNNDENSILHLDTGTNLGPVHGWADWSPLSD